MRSNTSRPPHSKPLYSCGNQSKTYQSNKLYVTTTFETTFLNIILVNTIPFSVFQVADSKKFSRKLLVYLSLFVVQARCQIHHWKCESTYKQPGLPKKANKYQYGFCQQIPNQKCQTKQIDTSMVPVFDNCSRKSKVKLCLCKPTVFMRQRKYKSIHSLISALDEVRGQFYAPAALSPG